MDSRAPVPAPLCEASPGQGGMVFRLLQLRHRLVLLILLILLPMVGYVSWDAYRQRQESLERATAEGERLAHTVVETQARVIQNAKSLLELLAQLPQVREFGQPACDALLRTTKAQQPRYASLAVFDARGETRCSALPVSRPVNASDRPWFN